MKIYKYRVKATDDSFQFEEVRFHTHLNLIVGLSGCGKTRLLNTLFNLGSLTVNAGVMYSNTEWVIEFECQNSLYCWELVTGENIVKSETLSNITDRNNPRIILTRNTSANTFNYNNSSLPKLSINVVSINILREEEIIKPIYDGFCRILRRNFSGPDLTEQQKTIELPDALENEISKNKPSLDLKRNIFLTPVPLSAKLFLFQKFLPKDYNNIIEQFKSVFKTIESAGIKTVAFFDNKVLKNTKAPVFFIQEKGVKKPIPIDQLSSGMLKTLLIITDMYSLSGDEVYIIDEYENSLGINAIDFFPNLIKQLNQTNQILISGHHPYIINSIPIEHWLLLKRKGSLITIKDGKFLKEKYGKSKQETFLQLFNDLQNNGEEV